MVRHLWRWLPLFGLGIAAAATLPKRRAANLSGEAALITGGSRGLGLLVARELAKQGCKLAICARDAEELETARQQLTTLGADVYALECNVADPEAVDRVVRLINSHFGGIDILVANAGIIQVGPLENMRIEEFQKALDIMFWGVVHPTLAVLPGMRARRHGRIAVVTSIGGKVSVPHLMPYSSAKFAAVGFAEGLRAEAAMDGISVTTVVPGLIRTGSFIQAGFTGNREAEYAWFRLGSSLPFPAMSAEKAARQIVDAIRRGESEVILTLPAQLLTRIHGVAPGLMSDALSLVNRLLPRSVPGSYGTEQGKTLSTPIDGTPLTALGDRAVERYQPPAA
jgi:short-subunit dehydrogenase